MALTRSMVVAISVVFNPSMVLPHRFRQGRKGLLGAGGAKGLKQPQQTGGRGLSSSPAADHHKLILIVDRYTRGGAGVGG
jgi:hypothetical protein